MTAALVDREVFVQAVKSCVNTPTRHGGRLIGGGLDCVGVPICALALCGVRIKEPPAYGNPPGAGALFTALNEHCKEVDIDDREPGDLLVALWRGEPRHLMVHVGHDHHGRILVVHARSGSGRVVIEPLRRGHRVVSCWRVVGVG